MNLLKIYIQEKEYPYSDEAFDINIAWARIRLSIQHSGIEKEVFDIEWDVKIFLEWLLENKVHIMSEEYPFPSEVPLSIAEKVFLFYNTEEDLDDKAADIMYDYRIRHGIWFGLRGTDVDNVYIGRNSGISEISFYDENQSWCFNVDLARFFQDIDFIANQVWRKN